MHNDEDAIDILVKIVVCGDSGVGKTNLLLRYLKNYFESDSKATIGVDFFSKDITVDQQKVSVQFFDTAGQEKYRSISSTYFKNSDGVLLVYDITDRANFGNLHTWIREVREYAAADVEILLAGNKSDLEDRRQISKDEGETFARNNQMFFMETSALTNSDMCVQRAFEWLINKICGRLKQKKKDIENHEFEELKRHSLKIQLNRSAIAPEKKSCC